MHTAAIETATERARHKDRKAFDPDRHVNPGRMVSIVDNISVSLPCENSIWAIPWPSLISARANTLHRLMADRLLSYSTFTWTEGRWA